MSENKHISIKGARVNNLKNIRMVISLFILCFASTLAFSSTNKEQQLEVLSDSISKK